MEDVEDQRYFSSYREVNCVAIAGSGVTVFFVFIVLGKVDSGGTKNRCYITFWTKKTSAQKASKRLIPAYMVSGKGLFVYGREHIGADRYPLTKLTTESCNVKERNHSALITISFDDIMDIYGEENDDDEDDESPRVELFPVDDGDYVSLVDKGTSESKEIAFRLPNMSYGIGLAF